MRELTPEQKNAVLDAFNSEGGKIYLAFLQETANTAARNLLSWECDPQAADRYRAINDICKRTWSFLADAGRMDNHAERQLI